MDPFRVRSDVVTDPERRPSPYPVLAAVSLGGVVGALARYLIATAWPHRASAFAWSTFTINVTGCLLIGVVIVLVGDHRLLRPLLGTGVLGGYTTFSTYIVDIQHSSPRISMVYLASTLVCALLAVWVGTTVTARLVRLLRSGSAVAAR